MDAKQLAGEAAIAELRSGQVVGLGTGSTADFFLQSLATALRDGRLRDIRGVPTSRQSERRAIELGIPLVGFDSVARIDVTVDGADEIGPDLSLIKGLGGALLREKIVAQNSDRLVIIADSSKLVPVLGSKGPLPVEVTAFGHEAQERFLRDLGATPRLRLSGPGKPFITDNGNYTFDCTFGRIDDPAALETTLARRAGIVESGLFVGLAKLALIANGDRVERRER
jgi:ribose 5-phosphate isomerase A